MFRRKVYIPREHANPHNDETKAFLRSLRNRTAGISFLHTHTLNFNLWFHEEHFVHWAARYANAEMLQALDNRGVFARFSLRTSSGESTFGLAVKANNKDAIKFFLNKFGISLLSDCNISKLETIDFICTFIAPSSLMTYARGYTKTVALYISIKYLSQCSPATFYEEAATLQSDSRLLETFISHCKALNITNWDDAMVWKTFQLSVSTHMLYAFSEHPYFRKFVLCKLCTQKYSCNSTIMEKVITAEPSALNFEFNYEGEDISPLKLALKKGSCSSVKLLVNRGAKVPEYLPTYLFTDYSVEDSTEKIKVLIPHSKVTTEHLKLYLASRIRFMSGYYSTKSGQVLQELFKKVDDVDGLVQVDGKTITLLEYAAKKGSSEAIEAFLGSKPYDHFNNEKYSKVLQAALIHCTPKDVEMLQDRVPAPPSSNASKILCKLIKRYSHDMIEAMLSLEIFDQATVKSLQPELKIMMQGYERDQLAAILAFSAQDLENANIKCNYSALLSSKMTKFIDFNKRTYTKYYKVVEKLLDLGGHWETFQKSRILQSGYSKLVELLLLHGEIGLKECRHYVCETDPATLSAILRYLPQYALEDFYRPETKRYAKLIKKALQSGRNSHLLLHLLPNKHFYQDVSIVTSIDRRYFKETEIPKPPSPPKSSTATSTAPKLLHMEPHLYDILNDIYETDEDLSYLGPEYDYDNHYYDHFNYDSDDEPWGFD